MSESQELRDKSEDENPEEQKSEEQKPDELISIAANLIDVDYINRNIAQLKADFESDSAMNKSMQIFFGVLAIGFALELYFHFLKLNNILCVVLLIFTGLIFTSTFASSKLKKMEVEIGLLEERKRMYSTVIQGDSSRHFDSLVSINIKNLEEYYDLVKTSNKRSFNVSLSMCIVGVLMIFGGAFYSYFTNDNSSFSLVVTFSGVVVEAISGLLFYLYNKTVIQLKDYHGSLLDVQNMLLSFKLIDDLKSEELKSKVMMQMIEFLVKRN